MTIIINLLCFIISFALVWIFLRDRFGIKQLGVICLGLSLFSLLLFFTAKYLNVGFGLLPNQPALRTPENAAKVTMLMFKTGLFFFPICYIFEFWYYKRHSDVDPYTGKKKILEDQPKHDE